MASDVLERTMNSHQAVRERAATSAVNDVSMNVKDFGMPVDKADRIQEAFRLGLLGDITGAAAKLNASGLEQNVVLLLVEEMKRQ